MATESGFVRDTFEKVLRLKEIFAAKGNALITRAAARDLYDWCNMLSEGLFEDAEIVERVKNHPMALWKCKE